MSETEIVTFGCRLNSFESEIIRRRARDAGLDNAVIVHTCAVTAEAERQARQSIRRAKRDRPDATIMVTGCSAQIAPEAYRAMPEVDRVVGNDKKLEAGSWQPQSETTVGDIMAVRDARVPAVEGLEGRTRAFVQVQNGCDHRCTFCVIPYGRGNNRSVATSDIISQIQTFIDHGYQEVVLTGVDIASWGGDFEQPATLGRLVEAILQAVPNLPRLRLTSLDPAAFDPLLIDLLISEGRLMPHVHLSLQAGDDMILKRMKRRHLRGDVIELCAHLRDGRPDMVFGADMIAGFPTETQAMFENSAAIIADAGLSFLHVFPYSPRPFTPAARMPQVEKAVRKERAAHLRTLGDAALARFLAAEMGRQRMVLVERGGRGHTEHFAPIRVRDDVPAGRLCPVAVDGVDNGILTGRLAA